MASDVMSHLYAVLSLPLQERVIELTRLIDQASPFKDLQAIFPQLVAHIFGVGSTLPAGWCLRTVTQENHPYEFDVLHRFLSPLGPMFRLCYKLLSDPQLKYCFPLNMLPYDIQQSLERGRYPQFYADLLHIDSQTVQLASLALNPFDYYMFHFASHLTTSNVNKYAWEGSSVYVALTCDYLYHFLPADPSVSVTPHIPYYTGKAPLVAPLQTTTRQLHSPSLLLIQDLPGMDSQHSPSAAQTQTRNETWRTESVMQIFSDIWLSIDDCAVNLVDSLGFTPQKCPLPSTTGERVKIARILVKQIHVFSSKAAADPVPRSSALRRCGRQAVCQKVYKFVTYLVSMWPLDSSFRLVLELWLSTIQPWRYTDWELFNRSQERNYGPMKRREDRVMRPVDLSHTQFIAENFPLYTTIFQQMIIRFMRLDLTIPKNAVMVFRLAKVFAQPNLCNIIRDIEMAALGQNIGMNQSADVSWNMSYGMQDVPMSNKWGAIAKQAIAELNPTSSPVYQAMWSDQNRDLMFELVRKMANAKLIATKTVAEIEAKLQQQNKGFWSSINFWSSNEDDDFLLADRKTVPPYLGTAIQYFCEIFGFDGSMLIAVEEAPMESSNDHSSYMSSSNTSQFVPRLRNKPTSIQYMGDPELIPIGTNECTVLVRMFYQLSARLNEMYQREMLDAWRRQDFWGYVSREVLQRPRIIHNYTKGGGLVSENLGPRISLRSFASKAFLTWLFLGGIVFHFMGYGFMSYLFILIVCQVCMIFCRAALKQCGLIKRGETDDS